MRSSLALVLALALALVPACAGPGGGGGAAPAATAPAPAAPPVAPAPDTDAIGTLEVHGSPPCRHLLPASGGPGFELLGALATDVEATLAASGHPVRVRGRAAPVVACTVAGAGGLEVLERSFTDGIYRTVAVAPGVTWHGARHAALFGATQTLNVLEVDPARPGVRVAPVAKPAGWTQGRVTSWIARTAPGNPRAAVNGGYFDANHDPVGLLKIGGAVIATNPTTRPPRSALGFFTDGRATIERVPGGDPWPAVHEALGAGPNLVTAGRPDVTRAGEGMLASLASRNPRTACGIKRTGEIVLLTADGRSAAGAGLTLAELARVLIVHGCERALNLDGGGSTTMWIAGQPDDGVVNYPSDDGNADHFGERRVANALVVFTP